MGFADDPPKYTPPPSYTTATGARIAKMLRNSIRRSVRRIMGESSRPRTSTAVQATNNSNINLPDYSTAATVTNHTRNTVSFINLDDERRPFSEPTSLATIVAQSQSSQEQGQSRSLSRNFDCLMFTNRRNTRSAENLVLSEVPISVSNGLEVLVIDASNDSVI